MNFILEQLSGLEEITYKPMMGEFIILQILLERYAYSEIVGTFILI